MGFSADSSDLVAGGPSFMSWPITPAAMVAMAPPREWPVTWIVSKRCVVDSSFRRISSFTHWK